MQLQNVDSHGSVSLWDLSCFKQGFLYVIVFFLVFIQSINSQSDLSVALSHLRLIPLHPIQPPIFCTSRVPLLSPTVKLQNLLGAIQTQKIYQYVLIMLLLTDEWMLLNCSCHKYWWPGMCQTSVVFLQLCNVVSKDIAIGRSHLFPPASFSTVNREKQMLIVKIVVFYQ